MANEVAEDLCEFTEETREVSPTNLVVKIEPLSLLPKYGIEKVESWAFEAGGYKWKVEIYPNGNRSEDEERHVSVYLSIAEIDSLPEGWEVNAIFTFFIHNLLLDNYRCFRESSLKTRNVLPAHVVTKIESFSMLSRHGIRKLESSEFDAGGYEWKFIINPDEGDYISTYLSMVGTSSLPACWEVNAFFNFFIYNHLLDEYHCFKGETRRFNAIISTWGIPELISKKDFMEPSNGFLWGDSCVFGAEIFFINNRPLIENVTAFGSSNMKFSKSESICNYGLSKWNIIVYPNGSKTRHLPDFLRRVDLKTWLHGRKVNAKSLFSLRNKLNDKKYHSSKEYSTEIRDTSPTHLLTTIEKFPMLLKHKIKFLETAEFEASDYKWKVKINLNKGGHISVNLSLVKTSSLPAGWEVNVIFNFILYNHISDKYHCFQGKARRFHSINSESEYSNLMSMKDLKDPSNGYLWKEKCVFGAEVFVIKNLPLIENVSVLDLTQTYRWEISNFSKLYDVCYSQVFYAGEYKWQITMHPYGTRRATGRYVSVYFNYFDANRFVLGNKVKAACNFCFRNMLNEKNSHSRTVTAWFTSTNSSWGFEEFTAIDDMRDPCKGYVVDDCCILEIQLSVLALKELIAL